MVGKSRKIIGSISIVIVVAALAITIAGMCVPYITFAMFEDKAYLYLFGDSEKWNVINSINMPETIGDIPGNGGPIAAYIIALCCIVMLIADILLNFILKKDYVLMGVFSVIAIIVVMIIFIIANAKTVALLNFIYGFDTQAVADAGWGYGYGISLLLFLFGTGTAIDAAILRFIAFYTPRPKVVQPPPEDEAPAPPKGYKPQHGADAK